MFFYKKCGIMEKRRINMELLKVVADGFKLCVDNFTISFVPTGNKTIADKEFELKEIAEGLYIYI